MTDAHFPMWSVFEHIIRAKPQPDEVLSYLPVLKSSRFEQYMLARLFGVGAGWSLRTPPLIYKKKARQRLHQIARIEGKARTEELNAVVAMRSLREYRSKKPSWVEAMALNPETGRVRSWLHQFVLAAQHPKRSKVRSLLEWLQDKADNLLCSVVRRLRRQKDKIADAIVIHQGTGNVVQAPSATDDGGSTGIALGVGAPLLAPNAGDTQRELRRLLPVGTRPIYDRLTNLGDEPDAWTEFTYEEMVKALAQQEARRFEEKHHRPPNLEEEEEELWADLKAEVQADFAQHGVRNPSVSLVRKHIPTNKNKLRKLIVAARAMVAGHLGVALLILLFIGTTSTFMVSGLGSGSGTAPVDAKPWASFTPSLDASFAPCEGTPSETPTAVMGGEFETLTPLVPCITMSTNDEITGGPRLSSLVATRLSAAQAMIVSDFTSHIVRESADIRSLAGAVKVTALDEGSGMTRDERARSAYELTRSVFILDRALHEMGTEPLFACTVSASAEVVGACELPPPSEVIDGSTWTTLSNHMTRTLRTARQLVVPDSLESVICEMVESDPITYGREVREMAAVNQVWRNLPCLQALQSPADPSSTSG